MNNEEIEIKFGVLGNPGNLMDLMSTFGKVSDPKTDSLSNVYFDTDDQQLFKIGAGLRIRRGNGFAEQTLKLRGSNVGGVHLRSEYNVKIDEDAELPELSKFPEDALPETLDLPTINDALKPVCEIDFERRSFNFSTMDSLFEVAYDHGTISVEGEPVVPINEIEIELKETKRPQDEIILIFCSLITTLAEKDLPLVLEPFSKMHRASLIKDSRKGSIDFAQKSEISSLPSYILCLVKSFENLYGLFLSKRDPLVFSCCIASLRTLIKSLKFLRKSGLAAFNQGEREPVNYSHDLKVLINVLSKFAGKIAKLERLVTKCSLNNDRYTLSIIAENLRKLENNYKIFVIPLKLKVFLSMLIR